MLLNADGNGLERSCGLPGQARFPWSIGGEDKILDLVESLKVTFLHIASECLRVLVDASVLSSEVDAIVLVRDGHLASLKVILHDLGGLGVVFGRVVLNLLCYLERASVLDGLRDGVDLDRAGFVGFVREHGLDFEKTFVEPLILL